jgi:hypothetical protein
MHWKGHNLVKNSIGYTRNCSSYERNSLQKSRRNSTTSAGFLLPWGRHSILLTPVEVRLYATWLRDAKGAAMFSFHSANTLPLSTCISSSLLSSPSSSPALLAERLPNHPYYHNHYLMVIWICHVGLCFAKCCLCLSPSSVSNFIIFLSS